MLPTNVTDVYQGIAGFYNEGSLSGNETMDFWENSPTEKVINGLIIVILFITMISIGCSMEVSKIKVHLLKPKGPVIALLAQFGIMPLAAFCISKILQLEPIKALCVLICGCCPGGTLSNIFSLAIKGDINLSIIMTTCSSIAALGMMPLLLYIYCQSFGGLEKAVPYLSIITTLALTMVPCAIGVVINHYKPRHSLIIRKVGFGITAISGATVLALAACLIKDKIYMILAVDVLAAAALLPLTGFMLGYTLSKICRLNSKCCRTISMETGCQNTNLCIAILKVAFSKEVIGPMFLFPLAFIILQCSEALLLTLAFRCYEKVKTQTQDMKSCKTAEVLLEVVKLQQYHKQPGTQKELDPAH